MVKSNLFVILQMLLFNIGIEAMAPALRQASLPVAKNMVRYGSKPVVNTLCSYDFNRFASTKILNESSGNNNRVSLVKPLLRGGANIKIEPLDFAVLDNRVESARALLELGACPEKVNSYGTPLLHNSNTPEIAKLLIEHGANLNSLDKYGNTALHNAKNDKMVKFFIDQGLDVNAKNTNGSRVLNKALLNKENFNKVETLLKFGADINLLDIHGTPLLHNSWTPEIARLLIEYGADLNSLDNYGNTALHNARNKQMVDFFVDEGFNVNAKNKFGYTPLHNSAPYQDEILKALLARGASVYCYDNDGNTVLHYAVLNKANVDNVETLLKFGADVNALNKFGRSPIDMAIPKTKILNLLLEARDKKISKYDYLNKLHNYFMYKLS